MLSGHAPWGSAQNDTSALQGRYSFDENNATYGLCTYCGSYTSDSSSRGISTTLSLIFQKALQQSSSPAKALQAVFTVTSTTQYYSRYGDFLSCPSCQSLILRRLPYDRRRAWFEVHEPDFSCTVQVRPPPLFTLRNRSGSGSRLQQRGTESIRDAARDGDGRVRRITAPA